MTPRTMRRVYLREAAVMLVLARLAVRFVSPARIFAWADRPPRRIRRFATDEIGRVWWAVEHLGGRPWMNALCLSRALAAHAMLRRRGIASRLCLGVARDRGAAGTLSAHAWVEVGDDKIVGGAEADGFTRLAMFGGALP
jgi:GNAT superfamily N-acetyltransferase